MKILFVLQEFPYPPESGVQVKIFELLKYIATYHECDVLVFCNSAQEAKVNELQQACPGVTVLKCFQRNSGVKLLLMRFLCLLQGTPIFLGRWRSGYFAEELKRVLVERYYDCVHLDALAMAQYLPFVTELPCVLSTTDAVSLAEARAATCMHTLWKRIHRNIMASLTARFEKRFLPRATKVHVVSEQDAKYLRQHVPNIDVVAIPLAISDDVLSYVPTVNTKNRFRVLATLSLDVEGLMMGLEKFIQSAWEKFHSLFPDSELFVIGRGSTPQRKEKLENSPGVYVKGWVADYLYEVTLADVIVFPDQSGTGLKTRVLYALGLGSAIVANSVAMEGIGAVDEVHYLHCELPEDFCTALSKLYLNTSYRLKLGESARKFASAHFSPNIVGSRWECVYNQIVEH